MWVALSRHGGEVLVALVLELAQQDPDRIRSHVVTVVRELWPRNGTPGESTESSHTHAHTRGKDVFADLRRQLSARTAAKLVKYARGGAGGDSKRDKSRHMRYPYLDEFCAVEMGEAVLVALRVVPDVGLLAGRLERVVQRLGPVHHRVLVGCV